jgi:hypothetical protein
MYLICVLDPRIDAQRERIDAAWQTLASKLGSRTLAHQSQWFWENLDWFSPPERRLRMYLIEDQSSPKALIPLESRLFRLGPGDIRVRGFIRHAAAPVGTAMFIDGDPGTVWDMFLNHLWKCDAPWDCLSTEGLEVGSVELMSLVQRLRPLTMVFERDPEPQYFISPQGTSDEYLRARPRRFRKNLRVAQRRLESLGKVAYGGEETSKEQGLREIERLDSRTWRMKKVEDQASNEGLLQYCQSLTRLFPDKDAHLFRFLSIDGSVVSANYYLRCDGVLYGVKNSFDETYASASPGMALIWEVIREVFNTDVERIEFNAKNWYALRICNASRHLARDLYFRRELRGIVWIAAMRIGRPLLRAWRRMSRTRP